MSECKECLRLHGLIGALPLEKIMRDLHYSAPDDERQLQDALAALLREQQTQKSLKGGGE